MELGRFVFLKDINLNLSLIIFIEQVETLPQDYKDRNLILGSIIIIEQVKTLR